MQMLDGWVSFQGGRWGGVSLCVPRNTALKTPSHSPSGGYHMARTQTRTHRAGLSLGSQASLLSVNYQKNKNKNTVTTWKYSTFYSGMLRTPSLGRQHLRSSEETAPRRQEGESSHTQFWGAGSLDMKDEISS